jgi:hypothetical protein
MAGSTLGFSATVEQSARMQSFKFIAFNSAHIRSSVREFETLTSPQFQNVVLTGMRIQRQTLGLLAEEANL